MTARGPILLLASQVTRYFTTFFLLFLAGISTASTTATIGAYYFDGWTSQSTHITDRLKNEFFDREPVWGWNDDSPQVMEQQINFAADNGISFFAFDWYFPEGESKYTPLNTGLQLYLQAPNRDRLQFCLMVANHGGFRVFPKDWDQLCSLWIPLLSKPSHLKVNGKPVIVFFSPGELMNAFGTTESVKAAFDKLNVRARDAGLPGVELAACATPGPQNNWSDLHGLASAGFTLFTGYNYHGYPRKTGEKIQAFQWMMDGHEEIWNKFAEKSPVPYMPCITAGWDARPWEPAEKPEKQGVYYPDRTPQQVGEFVRRAIRWMDDHADKTTAERIAIIYAWNENGEGGFLTPTKCAGDKYLKAVREATGQ